MPQPTKIFSNRPFRMGGAVVSKDGRHQAIASGVRIDVGARGIRDDSSYEVLNYNIPFYSTTETSQRIPDGTTRLEFQAREANNLRWSMTSGNAFYGLSPYFTLKAGGSYYSDMYPDEGLCGQTIYFASTASGTVEMRAHRGTGGEN